MPINGTYAIQCYNPLSGAYYTSEDIEFDASLSDTQYALQRSMPFMADTMEVLEDNRFDYRQNGISYMIHFHGLAVDIDNCEMVEGSGDYPITGNADLADNTTVLRHYAESLFFTTIPMEMLRTDAQEPQVEVIVDGRVALCTGLNCDYSYIATDAQVATQTMPSSSTLTITGQNLPIDDASMNITLGPVLCVPDSSSTTQIDCTLEHTAVAGDWIVVLKAEAGLIPNDIVDTISITSTISDVSPATDVNYLGGTTMTLTGDNFGYDPSVISVTYTDGTACVVYFAYMTEIMCLNDRFSADADTT